MRKQLIKLPKLIAVLFTVFLLCHCSKGPNEDELQRGIEKKLTQKFGPGVFAIDAFSKRGTYSYDDNGPKLLVYFKAKVRFEKDYKLSNWNDQRVGAFVSLMGSKPAGIKGISPTSNQKGDLVAVYGTVNFREADGNWELSTPFTQTAKTDPAKQSVKFVSEIDTSRKASAELPLLQRDIFEVNQISKFLRAQDKASYTYELHQAVRGSLKLLTLKLARTKNLTLLASGSTNGSYYALAAGIATLDKPVTLQNIETLGSIENIYHLQQHLVDYAIVQSDVAVQAYEGRGIFLTPMRNLRAVIALFPEAMHVVALKTIAADSFRNIEKLRVNIGANGSGTQSNAEAILNGLGVKLKNMKSVSRKPTAWAVSQMMKEELDVLFYTGAFPNPAIEQLLGTGGSEIVSLPAPLIAKMKKLEAYLPMSIPKNSYSLGGAAVSTLGVTALLVTLQETTNADVRSMLNKIYGNLPVLAQWTSQATYISKEHASAGVSIPIHSALGAD